MLEISSKELGDKLWAVPSSHEFTVMNHLGNWEILETFGFTFRAHNQIALSLRCIEFSS